jgi:predicted aldo/keto reductase-like oxidoreductase
METVRLGRTGLQVSRVGFGCLPIQRVSFPEAERLLRKAVDGGITFFDTARGYTDSEEKVGRALAGVRDRVVLATKIPAVSRTEFERKLETSLRHLRTEHVDVLQLHNPREVPERDDADSAWAAAAEARKQGKCRFVGVTNHRLDVAMAAAKSDLFDTVQFPLSAISSDQDLALIHLCGEHDLGVIAMKALCGGLLTNIPAAFAFLRQFAHLVPIWGIQREEELDEFLKLAADPPALDDAMRAAIEKDRGELAGDFCRGCGYCLPCSADIPIPVAARMKFLLRRSPPDRWLTEEWREKMARIENCQACGQCAERCPYDLHPPEILRKMYEDYRSFLSAN